MSNIIKIGDKDYPFHFGMRTLFDYSAAKGVEFGKISLSSYGEYMELFAFAVKGAIDRGAKGEAIETNELEDLLDRNPKAFAEIMDIFQNSEFQKGMEESDMVEDSKKKPKKATKKA